MHKTAAREQQMRFSQSSSCRSQLFMPQIELINPFTLSSSRIFNSHRSSLFFFKTLEFFIK